MILLTILPPLRQGHLVTILQVFQRITIGRIQFNSLLIVLRIQPGGSFKYFPTFPSFHKPFSYQALHLSFRPHQEIPRGHQTPPNCNVLYAIDKDIFQVINGKYICKLKISQYELTHASFSTTMLPQK
jgi:hypothetical protein